MGAVRGPQLLLTVPRINHEIPSLNSRMRVCPRPNKTIPSTSYSAKDDWEEVEDRDRAEAGCSVLASLTTLSTPLTGENLSAPLSSRECPKAMSGGACET